jgi:hypothetical protein
MEQEGATHETQEEAVDTQHEAHPHAHKRLIIGVSALAVVLIAAFIIWPRWGDTIKEKCFGDGEVCSVQLSDDL